METIHLHSSGFLKTGNFLKTLDFVPLRCHSLLPGEDKVVTVNLGGGGRHVTLSPVFFSPLRSLPFSNPMRSSQSSMQKSLQGQVKHLREV